MSVLSQRVRGVLAGTLDATGVLRRALDASSRATIVMYHRVLPDSSPEFRAADPGMVVSLETLRLHLGEFASRFDVVPLRELLAGRAQDGAARKPRLAMTFDDGWLDTYERAAPELRALHLPATVFAAVEYAEAGALGGPFASASQLAELARHGFEIGCHTWSHRELIGVAGAELVREIAGSRAWLEDAVGAPVVSFAYPRGKYDAAAVAAVRREYRYAVTVNRGFCGPGADPVLLPRIGIHDDMTNTLPRLRWRLAGLP